LSRVEFRYNKAPKPCPPGNRNGPHGWVNSLGDTNGGKMDRFLIQSNKGKTSNGTEACKPPAPECTPGETSSRSWERPARAAGALIQSREKKMDKKRSQNERSDVQ